MPLLKPSIGKDGNDLSQEELNKIVKNVRDFNGVPQ